MGSKLDKRLATACGLVALLALGACGNRGGEEAATRAARNETATEQAGSATSSGDAAARAAAQRSGSAELAQGRGS